MAINDDIKAQQKALDDAANSQSNYNGFIDRAANLIKNWSQAIKDGTNILGAMPKSLTDITDALGKFQILISTVQPFKNFATQGGIHINTLKDQADAFLSHFGKSVDALGPKTRNFFNALEQGQRFEQTYIGLAAATGKLDSIFTDLNTTVADGGKKYNLFDDRLTAVAKTMGDMVDATGSSINEISEYAALLGKIPGVMNDVITVHAAGRETFKGFDAALKLASGSGRSVQEVSQALSKAYDTLSVSQGAVNNSTERGLKFFALMSQTSNALSLNLEYTQQFLNNVADTFKDVGDNTEGASRVLGRFSGALRETGLTAKASVDIVDGMVKSVSQLSMGTKALISIRTGGPGGLQGAFKIEQLLREGKVDEVVKMMERTLRQQFGGRIYTQAEAAQSPQAAAQFFRQRQLVQSGAFGGLAKDEGSATRLLEAMAKGSGKEELINANSALQTGIDRGNQVQERQHTIMQKMAGTADKSLIIQSLQLTATIRNGLSMTGGIHNMRQEASGRLVNQAIQQRTGAPPAPGEMMQNLTMEIGHNLLDLFDTSPGDEADIKQKMSEAFEKIFAPIKAITGEDFNQTTKIDKTEMPGTALGQTGTTSLFGRFIDTILPRFDTSTNRFGGSVDKFSGTIMQFADTQSRRASMAPEDLPAGPNNEPLVLLVTVKADDGMSATVSPGAAAKESIMANNAAGISGGVRMVINRRG